MSQRRFCTTLASVPDGRTVRRALLCSSAPVVSSTGRAIRTRLPMAVTVAVGETKLFVDGEERYVWTAVDVDTPEVIHVEVSAGRYASTLGVSSDGARAMSGPAGLPCRLWPVVRSATGPVGFREPATRVGNETSSKWGFGVLGNRTGRCRHWFPHQSGLHTTALARNIRHAPQCNPPTSSPSLMCPVSVDRPPESRIVASEGDRSGRPPAPRYSVWMSTDPRLCPW